LICDRFFTVHAFGILEEVFGFGINFFANGSLDLEMMLKGRVIICIALYYVFIYSAQRFLGDNRNMAERFVESELSTQVKRRPTLTVVVTFIEKQLESLLMTMQQWGEDEVRTCNLERSYTLIFYNDYKM
jgi:hypothetical protein